MTHVELILTDSQAAELLPLVREQVYSRRGLLLMSVGPFLDSGTTRLRPGTKRSVADARGDAAQRVELMAVES
jgi:hypothetical protein